MIAHTKIYPFDDADSTAEAILIDGGRIAAVGSESDLRRRGSGTIESWDVHGATIMPGLIDTHPHLLHFAAGRASLVDITAAASHAEIVRRIADRARSTPEGEWIMTTPVGEPHYFIRRSYRDLEEGELPVRQAGSGFGHAPGGHCGLGTEYSQCHGIQFDGVAPAGHHP